MGLFSVLGNMNIRYITATLLLLSLLCLSSSRPQFLERFLSMLGGGRRQDGRLRYNLVQDRSPLQREFRARHGEQMERESFPSASATKNTCVCRCDCCDCCPCAEEFQYIDT